MDDVRFDIAPAPFAEIAALQDALGVSAVAAQILVRRGLADPAQATAFLAAADRHEDAEFGGLAAAAEHIARHVAAGSRIVVHGDYDCDGVTSTALLVRVLRDLGADPGWFLPSRTEDGYGLSAATVQRLADEGTALLVTVDCGITAVDEVALARTLGLDVVITDHHQPRADGALPDALLVHPLIGHYPCADLCAAGVAHRLARALYAAHGRDPAEADADLDLVALATVADVVPLRGENRRLVREGLEALRRTRRPGLRALLRVADADPAAVDEQTVGFRLAPRINAAGRMHRADAGVELLLTEDPDRAEAIAAELDRANDERRHVEQRILGAAEAQLREQGPAAAYVLAGDDWHPGVIGIVASRLAERHHRPVVLVAFDGDRGTGSGRSIPAFDLLAGLDAAAAHLVRHGGHRAAAGCTLERVELEAFRTAFVAHAQTTLRPEDLVPRERVDAVLSGDEAGLALAEELARLAPFGAGNRRPVLLMPAARLTEPRAMGEGRHVRFTVQSGSGRASAVAFGRGSLPDGAAFGLDCAFTLEINRWNGAEEARLVLRGTAAPGAGSIALVGAPVDFLAAAEAEAGALHAPVPQAPVPPATVPAPRERRGTGIAGTVASLVATGEPVLVVTACTERRLRSLDGRLGGFALCSWDALERDPSLVGGIAHLVALDPPLCAAHELAARAAAAGPVVHLAWGAPELRFSEDVLEHDHALRPGLTGLYRAVRDRPAAPLEELLHGPADARWTAVYAGRLLCVLEELDLIVVDRVAGTAAVTGAAGELEHSAAFRRVQARLEEGRRWLSRGSILAA